MRRVQAAALDLFETRGFAEVTIEEIAERAGVGPASVYRYFGTKERIVLWDEYDPGLFAALRARLAVPRRKSTTLLDVVESALVSELAVIYAEDRARILRRARLMLASPALVAASAGDRATFREGLSSLLMTVGACRDLLAASITAGVVAATLEACVDRWARDRGRVPLAAVLSQGFSRLRQLT